LYLNYSVIFVIFFIQFDLIIVFTIIKCLNLIIFIIKNYLSIFEEKQIKCIKW